MPIYIALLRGVNVGKNILKMDRLRELCAELKLKNARTLLQSGNIVFEAQATAAHWTETLERKLAGETRLPVSVIVRTAAEFAKVVAGNPFLKEKGLDPARLYVTFLQRAPAKSAFEGLRSLNAGADRFKCVGKEIFLHYLCASYHETKLTNNAFEKVLAVRATTRNWNTVNKLHEMSAE
ncbi:MAG: DUF1697 domain-containing protein [Candidatus Acidiferrales bacterium]